MIVCADVLDWAATYEGPKFYALLCDPPYELGFMGKDWDRSGVAFKPETWAALAEHLHPGAFGMAFASSRGWHRLAVAIEDAGLRIHPSIFGWSYGSGFPKATRIDTQIDKAAGATGEAGYRHREDGAWSDGWKNSSPQVYDEPLPATELAAAWQGHRYGLQAMKPALEPIIVFQKPYEGKPMECIVETGAGSLNIDGGRIGTDDNLNGGAYSPSVDGMSQNEVYGKYYKKPGDYQQPSGRWPANFTLTHHPDCARVGVERVKGTGVAHEQNASAGSVYGGGKGLISQSKGIEQQTYADSDGLETISKWDCVPECPIFRLGEQSGVRPAGAFPKHANRTRNLCMSGDNYERHRPERTETDAGTAARFFFQSSWELDHADPVFYCAKASRKERDAGLEEWEAQEAHWRENGLVQDRTWIDRKDGKGPVPVNAKLQPRRNSHPTVKPLSLAKWLATLLLPPPEYAPRRIMVPFMGSGSECIGAGLVGWEEIIGIDSDKEACAIAEARIAHWLKQPQQLELA